MSSIIDKNAQMDYILAHYRTQIGTDFERYNGHCYRVLNYVNLFGLEKEELYAASVIIPFHDLGIWTHHSMDYLDNSVREAKRFFHEKNMGVEDELIDSMILDHHKMTSTKSSLAEKLRKADLMDLSFGFIHFGRPGSQLKAIKSAFPSHGFQWDIYRKVTGYAVRHLGNPFPMMKI